MISTRELELKKMSNDTDPTAETRKQDHIELAFSSQIASGELDQRFSYEPLLAAHPAPGSLPAIPFLGKTLRAPVWVSSMTGGTEMAQTINHNLARACGEFGMGMGLGSCRSLLYGKDRLADFDVRHLLGDDFPLFANLGIAQIEELLFNKEEERIPEMLELLKADGLIVHVNPLQEWLQPEGDRFRQPPIDTIEQLIEAYPALPIIVKEVGQGMGRESLRVLLQLPIAAIDFAASGGTNFSKLELLRNDPEKQLIYSQLAFVGHTAEQMVQQVNDLVVELGEGVRCRQIIVSGGVRNYLDGYYYINKIQLPAIYGKASAFLRHAREDYDHLRQFVEAQLRGLELATAFLRIR